MVKKDKKHCDKCSSDRLLRVSGHTSNGFSCRYKEIEYIGYVPSHLSIGDSEDDVEPIICMECGKTQGKFPITDKVIRKTFEETGGEVIENG